MMLHVELTLADVPPQATLQNVENQIKRILQSMGPRVDSIVEVEE